jgi:hypothetical protein
MEILITILIVLAVILSVLLFANTLATLIAYSHKIGGEDVLKFLSERKFYMDSRIKDIVFTSEVDTENIGHFNSTRSLLFPYWVVFDRNYRKGVVVFRFSEAYHRIKEIHTQFLKMTDEEKDQLDWQLFVDRYGERGGVDDVLLEGLRGFKTSTEYKEWCERYEAVVEQRTVELEQSGG